MFKKCANLYCKPTSNFKPLNCLSSRRNVFYLIGRNLNYLYTHRNFKFSILRPFANTNIRNINQSARSYDEEEYKNFLNKYKEKLIYSDFFDGPKVKFTYLKYILLKNKEADEKLRIQQAMMKATPFPASLKYICDPVSQDNNETDANNEKNTANTLDEPVQFPFKSHQSHLLTDSDIEPQKNFDANNALQSNTLELEDEDVDDEETDHFPKGWMSDYDMYPEYEDEDNVYDAANLKYGTPNPNSKVSNVPCGGCGALLHCKDLSIPGYIPSEIFENAQKELQTIICQRCHFLKHYNLALQVKVAPEDYPRIISTITNKRALVVLMIDLLDFPCSIWPNIMNIIGGRRPIIVVGNKVDLLPQGPKGFLEKIKDALLQSLTNSGIMKANIKYISLISAKTGYGVEELITALHNCWRFKGDVYIVGCTNVGKSTLFNMLLHSDYCKVQASDLIQRATTSQWPGTTMNLLKFPILKPSVWRLQLRNNRLKSKKQQEAVERKLKMTQFHKNRNNPHFISLMGKVEMTFTPEQLATDKDPFLIKQERANNKIGIDENDEAFKESRWCYDTPGVVQPDQILHLLTTEELTQTIPKEIILPRSFTIRPKWTLFIAGLGRLDFLETSDSGKLRITVLCSRDLPLTICETSEADNLYSELLGSEILRVPFGSEQRLSKWPSLKSKDEIKLVGTGWKVSCADIVLSSAGWVAVTAASNTVCKFKAWTPEGRGIYVRQPPLLPYAINLRGSRVRQTPAYRYIF